MRSDDDDDVVVVVVLLHLLRDSLTKHLTSAESRGNDDNGDADVTAPFLLLLLLLLQLLMLRVLAVI